MDGFPQKLFTDGKRLETAMGLHVAEADTPEGAYEMARRWNTQPDLLATLQRIEGATYTGDMRSLAASIKRIARDAIARATAP